MNLCRKLDYLLEKLCSYALVVCILTILFLSSSTIILRWFDVTWHWVDPLVRHLVLFGTFFGGVIATGRGGHIGIDLMAKILEIKGHHRSQRTINRIIYLASCLVLIWFVKASIDFAKLEIEYGKEVFWGLKSGHMVSMIPIGAALIALKFFLLFIFSFDHKKDVKEAGAV